MKEKKFFVGKCLIVKANLIFSIFEQVFIFSYTLSCAAFFIYFCGVYERKRNLAEANKQQRFRVRICFYCILYLCSFRMRLRRQRRCLWRHLAVFLFLLRCHPFHLHRLSRLPHRRFHLQDLWQADPESRTWTKLYLPDQACVEMFSKCVLDCQCRTSLSSRREGLTGPR